MPKRSTDAREQPGCSAHESKEGTKRQGRVSREQPARIPNISRKSNGLNHGQTDRLRMYEDEAKIQLQILTLILKLAGLLAIDLVHQG